MQSGDILHPYVVLEWLGVGGMAEVWKGKHIHLGQEVAIKSLKAQFAHDAVLEERFLNEGKQQANLDHPNIVRATDFISHDGRNYLVTRYIDGGSLEHRMKEANGPLPMPETLLVSRQVLSALDHAHRQGVIHRDVKSSNILRDREGNCYLTDFGIALVIGEQRLTRTGAVMGTGYYMSPEQIRSPHLVDHRTDVYAFGVVLFEMLTGVLPFNFDNDFLLSKAHVEEPPPKPSKLNPAVSKTVESVVLRALAKNPDDRWAGCREMSAALEAAAGDLDTASPTASRPDTASRKARPTAASTATPPDSSSITPSLAAPRPDRRTARSKALTLLATGAAVAILLAVLAARYFAKRESVAAAKTQTAQPQPDSPAVPNLPPPAVAPKRDDVPSEPAKVTPERRTKTRNASIVVEDTKKTIGNPGPVTPVKPAPPSGTSQPSGDAGSPETRAATEDLSALLKDGKQQLQSDPAAARELFRRAADAGSPQAMVLLGFMYSSGSGGPKDDAEAVQMFRQAAQLGYDRGMFNLALMYESSRGVPPAPGNQAQAAYWYRQALKGNRSGDAALRLGIMYEQGRGVPKDLNQAEQLYQMAGTPEAADRLAKIRAH